jgi:AraC-like DNA-binding protein
MLLHYAEQQGLDRAVLLVKSGLTEDIIADPDGRIPTKQMVRLWQTLIDELDDPLLGLKVGAGPRVTEFGLVGYAMLYSDTLLDALSRLARYQRILSEAIRFTLNEKSDSYELAWVMQPALMALRHPVESNVHLVLRAARELTGISVSPLAVELPTPPPANQAEYKKTLGCPISFGCDRAAILWRPEQMLLPTVAADDALAGYLDELADIAVGPLDEGFDSTTTAVRRTLWSLLPSGRPGIGRTAREMGITVRTLQRRLSDEGSSFSVVLDTLRRDVTAELMADGRQPAADISFLLGYSEPSAFYRAYRRWRGSDTERGMN